MTEDFAKCRADDFGLYIHIPFCRSICYYCDFYKTASHQPGLPQAYFAALAQHLKAWLQSGHIPAKPWTSVFFGGGTPSMFVHEYQAIMDLLSEHITADCEITLEANVDDISAPNLSGWRSLGFNRLSLGVQSLDPVHLKFLTRAHSAAEALEAIELAVKWFASFNVDMIYGMPEHKLDEWNRDLLTLARLGVGHLSLYNLTYEKRTPLCKFMEKGRFTPLPETAEAELYALAHEQLASLGYQHEEVSNWSLPTKSCRHNWLYWQDRHYLGIGAAAHGYLPGESPYGIRFSYPQSAAAFIASRPQTNTSSLNEMIDVSGGSIDIRDLEAWVLEIVGCSLRTHRGVDTALILAKTKGTFKPTAIVARGVAEGSLYWHESHLILHTDQWFCESAWSLAVASSFSIPS